MKLLIVIAVCLIGAASAARERGEGEHIPDHFPEPHPRDPRPRPRPRPSHLPPRPRPDDRFHCFGRFDQDLCYPWYESWCYANFEPWFYDGCGDWWQHICSFNPSIRYRDSCEFWLEGQPRLLDALDRRPIPEPRIPEPPRLPPIPPPIPRPIPIPIPRGDRCYRRFYEPACDTWWIRYCDPNPFSWFYSPECDPWWEEICGFRGSHGPRHRSNCKSWRSHHDASDPSHHWDREGRPLPLGAEVLTGKLNEPETCNGEVVSAFIRGQIAVPARDLIKLFKPHFKKKVLTALAQTPSEIDIIAKNHFVHVDYLKDLVGEEHVVEESFLSDLFGVAKKVIPAVPGIISNVVKDATAPNTSTGQKIVNSLEDVGKGLFSAFGIHF